MKAVSQDRKKRAKKILSVLKRLFPKAGIVLRYSNPWELLVSVMLSAQCTDKKVNEVTEKLFRKYKTLDDYAKASQKEFEQDIRPTGFFRNKTAHILATAHIVKETYGGIVPSSMEDLLALPGVARKTANIVLGNAYGIVEGIAVDTHVRRLAIKLGLTDKKDPAKIEKDLMELLPRSEWFRFPYYMIEYGRQICPARKHECEHHPLTKLYPPAAKLWP